ncbi:MAG: helix-turn-helix transcriptional regulator [Cyclobacteriaceae bacterium]|nr:helix-turn-helix transcriptional regulator [Cyclobacteriaceae bacterium HetDA_MAG_MS6]
MKVLEFDTSKGLYAFQFYALETEFHRHPAIEMVIAEKGYFDLSTEKATYNNLSFAVIDSNVKHKLAVSGNPIKVVVIEHHRNQVKEILAQFKIQLRDGLHIHIETNDSEPNFEDLYQRLLKIENVLEYDERIIIVIQYLNNHDLGFEEMMNTLTQLTHLSRSRLSHLFKEHVGISLKKYMVWCKLRSTISQHLDKKQDLFSSLIQNGFYDHPHFSKSFKTMLGVKPSTVYNSRTVQF